MKKLITISEITFGRSIPVNVQYRIRKAARAVLTDDTGGVYLLNVTSQGYHKLPGGGIDQGEDAREALKREIMEEVGCNSEISDELGEVIELRPYEDFLEQHSFNYFARQVGLRGNQKLEQDEIDEGHELVIAKDINDAIAILEADKPKNIEGEYIRLRDLTILKEAKNRLLA